MYPHPFLPHTFSHLIYGWVDEVEGCGGKCGGGRTSLGTQRDPAVKKCGGSKVWGKCGRRWRAEGCGREAGSSAAGVLRPPLPLLLPGLGFSLHEKLLPLQEKLLP